MGYYTVAVVKYTFTHKKKNTQNDTKQKYIEKHNKFWKSAGRALSLQVIPWHLPYN